jgi:large subunit ribosomal protein L19
MPIDVRNLQELKPNPKVAAVRPGDTVKVVSQVKEGDRTRNQLFQGVVIKEGGSGPAKWFTVRRISYGVGVERTFLVHSPLLESVEVLRHGKVRRAKLFYLRGLSARDARIKEGERLMVQEAGASEPAAGAEPSPDSIGGSPESSKDVETTAAEAAAKQPAPAAAAPETPAGAPPAKS